MINFTPHEASIDPTTIIFSVCLFLIATIIVVSLATSKSSKKKQAAIFVSSFALLGLVGVLFSPHEARAQAATADSESVSNSIRATYGLIQEFTDDELKTLQTVDNTQDLKSTCGELFCDDAPENSLWFGKTVTKWNDFYQQYLTFRIQVVDGDSYSLTASAIPYQSLS
jgi:hypothetical protein